LVASPSFLLWFLAVVQFYYGEDGLDVTQVSYLRSYDFIARNAAAAALKVGLNPGSSSSSGGGVLEQAVTAALRERTKLLKKARKGDLEAQQQLKEHLPVMARFFPSLLGVTSESFGDKLLDYCSANKENMLWEGEGGGSGSGSSKKRKKGKAEQQQQQQQGVAPPGFIALEGEGVRG
jgi:DNA-directed RNA polymerase I subunit RPA1